MLDKLMFDVKSSFVSEPSERINFIFTSELYNDEIQFDLPVSKQ